MAAVTEADIKQELADASSNPDLVSRCLRICQDYKLTASELAVQWDLLTMNSAVRKRMSLEMLSELETQARDEHLSKRAKHDKASRQFTSRTKAGTFTKDTTHLLHQETSPTARKPVQNLTPSTTYGGASSQGVSPTANSFASRSDAGKVVVALNAAAGMVASESQVEVRTVAEPSDEVLGASFMWEKLDQRAKLLDAQVAALEAELSGRDDVPPLVSITTTGPDEVTVVGRVCCEGEGKLNAQSIFLEGSRATSNAVRVRLDLSGCPDFALFAGQVLAAVGLNSVGHTFVAKRVLSVMPPAANARPPKSASATAGSPAVSLLAASGPYTTSDDLAYAPLAALVQRAVEDRPDALVLLGPFVDDQHPKLASTDLPLSYDELFDQQVVRPLVELIEMQLEKDDGRVTHVILIPSTRDLHHASAYPQPPLLLPELPQHVVPHLHVHTNPSVFTVGSVRVAASSLDTLMLLGQSELARAPPPAAGAPKPDRMARLASHLLQQRHLLPLFPAPSDERSPLAVDTVANMKAGALPALPDVLLSPSDLAPFAKFGFAGVLCVNPGRLTRKSAGGNYAAICIHPPGKITRPKEVLQAREEAEQLLGAVDFGASPQADDAAAAAAPSATPAPAAEEVKSEVKAEVKPEAVAADQPPQAEPAASQAEGSKPSEAQSAAEPSTSTAAASTAVAAAAAPTSATLTQPWLSPVDAPVGLDYRAYVEVKRI